MARANVKGSLYLLHFPQGIESRPGCFSRHYLGWTGNGVDERIAQHLSGQGSPLIRAAIERGMTPELVRTWANMTRNDERQIKRTNNLPQFCPLCNTTGRKR